MGWPLQHENMRVSIYRAEDNEDVKFPIRCWGRCKVLGSSTLIYEIFMRIDCYEYLIPSHRLRPHTRERKIFWASETEILQAKRFLSAMIQDDSVGNVEIFVINQNNVPRMLQVIVCKKSVEFKKVPKRKTLVECKRWFIPIDSFVSLLLLRYTTGQKYKILIEFQAPYVPHHSSDKQWVKV